MFSGHMPRHPNTLGGIIKTEKTQKKRQLLRAVNYTKHAGTARRRGGGVYANICAPCPRAAFEIQDMVVQV